MDEREAALRRAAELGIDFLAALHERHVGARMDAAGVRAPSPGRAPDQRQRPGHGGRGARRRRRSGARGFGRAALLRLRHRRRVARRRRPPTGSPARGSRTARSTPCRRRPRPPRRWPARWMLELLGLPRRRERRLPNRRRTRQRGGHRGRPSRVLARARLGRRGARPARRPAGHGRRRRRGATPPLSRRSAISVSVASAWSACPRTSRAACAPTRSARARDADGPTIVCLQAGNVNTGAFDPLE